MISESLTASDLIRDLASRGRATFTTKQALAALDSPPVAVRAALRRLAAKGQIASPYRGFYTIVPPEYLRLGCLPAEQFLPDLMQHLGVSYYAGLLTAAQFHGAAHQRPQEFQVMVGQDRRPLACGQVRVAFVTRKNVDRIPTQFFHTTQGEIRVSTPEATALDLVGYPKHCGGLDNVATVLAELAEKIDAKRLVQLAATTSPKPWVQRLGFLLESVGRPEITEPLAAWIAREKPAVTPLAPKQTTQGAAHDTRWRVAINITVEPEL